MENKDGFLKNQDVKMFVKNCYIYVQKKKTQKIKMKRNINKFEKKFQSK